MDRLVHYSLALPPGEPRRDLIWQLGTVFFTDVEARLAADWTLCHYYSQNMHRIAAWPAGEQAAAAAA